MRCGVWLCGFDAGKEAVRYLRLTTAHSRSLTRLGWRRRPIMRAFSSQRVRHIRALSLSETLRTSSILL